MNSNLKNFTLEDIEIDDEAMEDLETFNEKYYNKLVNNVEETKEEKTINDLYIGPISLIQENAKIFSVKRSFPARLGGCKNVLPAAREARRISAVLPRQKVFHKKCLYIP